MVKEFSTHEQALQEGATIMVCRLALLDTIQSVPVFKLQRGKSVLKKSIIDLTGCDPYVYYVYILIDVYLYFY